MMKKFALVAGALVVAGGIGLWTAGSMTPPASLLAPVAAQAQETTATTGTATTVAEIQDFGLGVIDAPVKMIEYASFTCPHCANFHADVFPKLKADYIDTGKVRFEYREV